MTVILCYSHRRLELDTVRFTHARSALPYLALALLAPLLLAAACLSVLVIDDIRLSGQPAAAITPNQLVMMCVSLRLTGNWRAATWWSAAVSARTGRLRRPYIQSNIACGLVPWQSWLPSSGTIQTSN